MGIGAALKAAPWGGGYWLNRVRFSGDGKYAVAAGGGLILYDLDTGKEVRRVMEVGGARPGLDVSRDGKYALTLTGGDEGRNIARLWKIPIPIGGDANRLSLWAQTLTGMELDSDDAARALDASSWQSRRNQLQQLGGPPRF